MMSNGPCRLAFVPQRLPLDRGRVDLLRRFQDVDMAEALRSGPAASGAAAASDCGDVRAEIAVRARAVAFAGRLLRQVEDDRDRQDVVLASQLDQRLARFRLDVRGVDDGQPSGASRLRSDEVQRVEGSLVADWSFSSSETSPRQKSDERTPSA